MDSVIPSPSSLVRGEAERRLRAFRAMDALTMEAYQAARLVGERDGDGLAVEIRRIAARAGGALLAACASVPGSRLEREGLEAARSGVLEGRHYLYLARRMGFLDVRRYRAVTQRQEATLREIDGLLGEAAARAP